LILTSGFTTRNSQAAGHAVSPSLRGIPSLHEEPILNLAKFHRRRTVGVIVHHIVDPVAHRIAPRQPGVLKLQQVGCRMTGSEGIRADQQPDPLTR
jgi:hypothetical protein